MELTAKVLEDGFVRLEPFSEARKEELRAACAADPVTWNELYPYSMLGDEFDRHWRRLAKETEAGKTLAFAVVVDGVCRGMTTYIAIDPINRSLEIGATYYEPSARGGAV